MCHTCARPGRGGRGDVVRGGERNAESEYAGLPTGAWPSATAVAPVYLIGESYPTCQGCMSVSKQIKQNKP